MIEGQRQLQFLGENRLQACQVDLAIGLQGRLQTLGRQAVATARHVNSPGGEIHGKGNQSRNDEEQHTDRIHRGNGRVDLPGNLPTPLRIEEGAAGA